MTSPLQEQDRLDEIAAAIRRLKKDLVEHERAAFDCGDQRAIEKAALARGQLDAALATYFMTAEAARSMRCTVHGAAAIAACPDCARVPAANTAAEVISLDRGLELSARLVDEAKRLGCEPREALQLARWISNLSEEERGALVRTAARIGKARKRA